MMGVLFAADESMNKVLEAAKLIGAKFPHLEYFETERLISGGYCGECGWISGGFRRSRGYERG